MIKPIKQKYKGFTLIELLIVVAIIGTLTAVGVPIVQNIITESKESTAKDNLRSIAFMQQDQYRESRQYHPCPKKTLDTNQIDKQFFGGQGELSGDYSYKITGGCSSFDASALIANSKAKCFKIDQSRSISTIACPKIVVKTGNCTIKSGTRISGGSVVSCVGGQLVNKPLNTKDFSNYKPPTIAGQGNGSWVVVDSNGKQVKGQGGMVCSLSFCGPGGGIYDWGSASFGGNAPWGKGTLAQNNYKVVFEAPSNKGSMAGNYQSSGNIKDQLTYNFSTGIWSRGDGIKRDTNGNYIK
jgi:prepilin-type N-terminal cleavage/methylation domain-containing protein